MFAVIKTGGKQYKAQEGDILQIEKIDYKKGQKVTFNRVLLVEDSGKTLIGTPYVEDAAVNGVVLENFKDKKVIVFKKKRRKGYRRTRGHRQELTRIRIEEIVTGKPAAAVEKKETGAKKQAPKKAEAAGKKAEAKKPAAKKETAKKPAAKKTSGSRKTSAGKSTAKKSGAKAKEAKAPAKKTAAKKTTKPKSRQSSSSSQKKTIKKGSSDKE